MANKSAEELAIGSLSPLTQKLFMLLYKRCFYHSCPNIESGTQTSTGGFKHAYIDLTVIILFVLMSHLEDRDE